LRAASRAGRQCHSFNRHSHVSSRTQNRVRLDRLQRPICLLLAAYCSLLTLPVSSFRLPSVPAACIAPAVLVVSAVEAAPLADAPVAKRHAVQFARDSVAVGPAAAPAVCAVQAPAASAPAAVANDAPALAVFDFAGAAHAEVAPAVAQHAVAAVAELFVVWRHLFAPAVARASSVADPADGLVGLLVGPPPGRSHLELFADPTAGSATAAFAGARFGRPAQLVLPGQPSVVRAPALSQDLAAGSLASFEPRSLHADP
jgi:hypothetical protein